MRPTRRQEPRSARRTLALVYASTTLALLGCHRPEEPQAKQPTPVRVRVVAESTDRSAVRFSGSIEPGTRVELAFKVGGYQVCEKWLKDRKGRALSFDDLQHYTRMIISLRETRRIMAEIDEVIPGWPLA